MALVFDTETTGIPRRRNGQYSPQNVVDFDGARLVSIAWKFLDGPLVVHTVRPDGFRIPEDVSRIHGITQEIAATTGTPLADVLREFIADLRRATVLVAHNIDFDVAIVKSELHRMLAVSECCANDTANNNADLLWCVATLESCPRFCTMQRGYESLKLAKWPRLPELYRLVTGLEADVSRLHTAGYDVHCCAACYAALIGNGLPNK
jgi:DNA polymerase-3 subunit alpha